LLVLDERFQFLMVLFDQLPNGGFGGALFEPIACRPVVAEMKIPGVVYDPVAHSLFDPNILA
jgi:hypothetical protein